MVLVLHNSLQNKLGHTQEPEFITPEFPEKVHRNQK